MTGVAVDGENPPDPQGARTPAEFIERLQALKDWSGLTYRELSQRAEAVGDVLPRSTVANMLARTTVPREELLTAFVRACGCGPGVVDAWQRVRKDLVRQERRAESLVFEQSPSAAERDGAALGEVEAGDGTAALPEPEPRARPWGARRVRIAVAVAVAGVLAAAVSVTYALSDGDDRKPDAGPTPDASPTSDEIFVPPKYPKTGPVRIRAVHSGLCLAERPGQKSGELFQVRCSPDSVPRFVLEAHEAYEALWQLTTKHPDYGPGCTGIHDKSTLPGAAFIDQECGKRGVAEAFRLEPVGDPVRGYRLRVGWSDLCMTVKQGDAAEWAEIIQMPCATEDGPVTKESQGQLFAFDPDTKGRSTSPPP
ncbi:helix-turn-helix domain-containing protein [Streptomyces sp. NPDC000410]|uniref:helix-turn-helix domain-containing protein n=1 Tax=Streptomyces sp. NPDC000410 TaxID=3154254 RepID=UPI0033250E50